MRMKEVCERTGLTDRAVRLYIDSGLVDPKRESSYTGRSAIYFNEADIEKLQTVAVLRKAGFSIADIKIMLLHTEQIPAVISSHKATLEEEISQKRSVLKTLSNLSDPSLESCSALAAAIGRSSPELSTPKEDLYMSFEEIRKNLRNRLPSTFAFAALLVGMICFLVLGIKTAFTEVLALKGGGYMSVYEVIFDGSRSVLILLPAFISALSCVSVIPRLAGGGRKWIVISLILCALSAAAMLLLPTDVRERMFLHEYITYRYSFMHAIIPGRSVAMDIFIASLKYIPHFVGGILISVGLLKENRISK